MNKKGFTLVEILCVILLIGVIAVLIVPSYTKLSMNSKNNIFDSKVVKIEGAAKEYGNDHLDDLSSETSKKPITVNDLINNGYLTAESEGKILNPINGGSMNDCEINIWYDNNKVKSEFKKEGTNCKR